MCLFFYAQTLINPPAFRPANSFLLRRYSGDSERMNKSAFPFDFLAFLVSRAQKGLDYRGEFLIFAFF